MSSTLTQFTATLVRPTKPVTSIRVRPKRSRSEYRSESITRSNNHSDWGPHPSSKSYRHNHLALATSYVARCGNTLSTPRRPSGPRLRSLREVSSDSLLRHASVPSLDNALAKVEESANLSANEHFVIHNVNEGGRRSHKRPKP